LVYRGVGFVCLGNILWGFLAGLVGYWFLGKLGVSLGSGWVGAILTGAIGAIVILVLINLVVRRTP